MEESMRNVLAIGVALVLAAPLSAQSSCKLEGVWELVSGTSDGKPYPAGLRQIKIITKGHFAVLWREADTPKQVRTTADSLAFFRHIGSGGGTYTLKGTAYTERVDYFSAPAVVGMGLPFTCRTEGDRFYQSGTFPVFEGGRKVRDLKLEEVWKRIE
jgi:hypothetical protein